MGESGPETIQLVNGTWQIISHNWALFSILLTLVLLTVVPALILGKYVRITLNIIRNTVPPLFRSQVGFLPFSGEDKDFYAADGVRLRGSLYRSTASEPTGMIVFAPEYQSDRHSCARYCRGLLAGGYDVLSFDFRGQGESASEEGYSPRQWASDREVADMRGAISYAEHWLEQEGRPVEIGLFGISRGACAAILASEDHPSVKAIVTDGAFSSDCTLEHFLKKWANIFATVRVVYENHPPEFWRFLRWCVFWTCRIKLKCRYPSVRKALMRMTPRPVLLIHGERDSYIPVEQSRLLYALSAQPKHLWAVPGAKHNQSVDVRPVEYARRTVEFFDRYLARRSDLGNMYNAGRFLEIARATAGRRETAAADDAVGEGLAAARVRERLRVKEEAAPVGDPANN